MTLIKPHMQYKIPNNIMFEFLEITIQKRSGDEAHMNKGMDKTKLQLIGN